MMPKQTTSIYGFVSFTIISSFVINAHGIAYYSVCNDPNSIQVGREKIRIGSGSTENQTGFQSSLECLRAVLSPQGWRIAVRFIRRDLFRDYIRMYDGDHLANHVPKVNIIDTGTCNDCPEKYPTANSSGNALFLKFISGSVPNPSGRSFLLELSASPPSPGCKCPAVVHGQMSCSFYGEWHARRNKKCRVSCDPGRKLINNAVFAAMGSKSSCDVDQGGWGLAGSKKLEDIAFCQNKSTPNTAVVRYEYHYVNISCQAVNMSRDNLLGTFELFIQNNSSLPQNGVCFSDNGHANCTVQRLELSCSKIDENKTMVAVTVRDHTPAASGSNETAKTTQFDALYSGRINGFTHLWTLFNYYLRGRGQLDIISNNVTYKAEMKSPPFRSQSTLAYGTCESPNVFLTMPGALCAVCPQGYQRVVSFAFFCSKCAIGSSCYEASRINQTHSNCNLTCPVGKGYNDSLGFCEWCPRNTYQEFKNAVMPFCTTCPASKITPYVGAKNVSDCIDPCTNGTYLVVRPYQTGICVKCPMDTYMDAGSHDYRQCKPCGMGKMTLNNGSASAHDCVEKCLPGNYLNTTTRKCQPCANSFYQEQLGQILCRACVEGRITLSNGTNSSSGCVTPCSNGTYMLVTGFQRRRCVVCPVNTYMDEEGHDLKTCKPCGAGMMTLQNGSTSGEDCVTRCSPGSYLDMANNRACQPCEKNSYQDQYGQVKCIPCPTDHVTLRNGTSNSSHCIKSCPRGWFVDDLGPPVNCSRCPRGTYQDTLGVPHCIRCPNGKGTLYKGTKNASACVDPCSFGTHLDSVNPRNCVQCPIGSYQDKNVTFESTCTKCPDPKTTTFRLGARNASECLGYCSSSPCFHGSSCVNMNGTFRCKCARGLGGERCEDILDQHAAENITVSVTFTSLIWQDSLLNPNSNEFKATAAKIEASIQATLRSDPNFRTAKVTELKNGSVVATVDITSVAENALVRPLEALEQAVKNGQVGELAVKNDSLSLLSYSCGQPLGMQDMRIANDQISASTYKDSNGSRPWDGRLRAPGLHYDRSWEANVVDDKQYLQIDFRSRVRITAVATQGERFNTYTTTYTLAFSDDGRTWNTYQEIPRQDKIFTGNTESYLTVKNTLPTPKDARYIRLHPVTWNADISMTMEVYGCIQPSLATPTNTTTTPPIVTSSSVMTSSPVTSSVMTSSPVTSPSTMTSSVTSVPTEPGGTDTGGLSKAAIVAISVLCVVVVLVCIIVVVWYMKRRGDGIRGNERKAVYPLAEEEDFPNPTYGESFEMDDKNTLTTQF